MTSGLDRSSSSVGDAGLVGFVVAATTGIATGSPLDEAAMSADPAAAQTRPPASATMAVTSGLPES